MPSKPPNKQRARAAAATDETTGQRVNRLAQGYYDANKLSSFAAVRGIVKKAVAAGLDDTTITNGLQKVLDEKRPLTATTLHVAIYGHTSTSKTAAVYRDDAPREYTKWS